MSSVSYKLKSPLVIDGLTIEAVELRALKGRDLVTIGDAIAVLARLEDGRMPDSAAFSAMLVIASAITGVGDRAEELGAADLIGIITKFSESVSFLGSGTAPNGETPSVTHLAS